MVKFATSGPNNPCPVCGRGAPGNPRQDKDCRISLDEGLVLCHTEVNHREKGEELNGHIYIGEDEGGLWGRWRAKTADFVKERPIGQQFRYPFTDCTGQVVVEEVRVYKATGKDSWMEPAGVDMGTLSPYRYTEAIAALQAGAPHCFLVEGPPKADVLWDIGFPSVTFAIGFKPSRDSHWFEGYEDRLVVVPDQDGPGVAKAAKVAAAYPMAKSFRPWPNSARWLPDWIPEKGGADVRDWVDELRRRGVGDEEIQSMILAGIEDRRPAAPVSPVTTVTTVTTPVSKNSPEDHDSEEISAESIHEEVNLRADNFDISKLFHPKIVDGLRDIATIFNQPEAVIAAPLLSVVSSLIKTGTTIYLGGVTKQAEPPIIWTALTGNSDDGKSPILGILTKPLKKLQATAWDSYKEQIKVYETEMSAWDATPKKERKELPRKPNMPIFTVSDFTQEALVNAVQNFPEKGILINVDELGGLFESFNQYKKSGGGDRKKFMELYNGSDVSVIRKNSDPIYIKQTSISVTGGIQPTVLRDAMGNLGQVDGLWPRFLYARMVNSRMPQLDILGEKENTFDEDLEKACIYIRTGLADDQCEPQYHLSPEAKAHWRVWHELTEDGRFEHDHQAKIALFRKARGRAARIALVAHIFNAAVEEKFPDAFISGETMLAAIEFTQWGINQILSLYDEYGLSNTPEATKVAKFVTHFKDAGWIDWKRVRSNWSAKEKPNLETCLEFMTKLVTLGYAIDNGEPGSKLKISIRKSSHVVTEFQNPQKSKESDAKKSSHGLVTVTKTSSHEQPQINHQDNSVTNPVVTVTKSVTTDNCSPNKSSGAYDYVTNDLSKNSKNASDQHPANLNGQDNGSPNAKGQIQIGEIVKLGRDINQVLNSHKTYLITKLKPETQKADIRCEDWGTGVADREVDLTDIEPVEGD